MNYPKDVVRRALEGSGQAEGYVFYLPGRQQAGAALDFSDAGLSTLRKSGLSEVQMWATPGYISAVAGNDGYSYVTSPDVACDWSTECLIFSTRIKMAAPAANATICGTGTAASSHGFYLSARVSGKILVNLSSDAGAYNPGETPGVILDNSEHAFGVVVDGPNRQIWCYVDGGLAFAGSEIAVSGITNIPTAFALGAASHSASVVASAAVSLRELHMIKRARLPVNVDEIMLRLATSSGVLRESEVRDD
jgi:hypothetical protein